MPNQNGLIGPKGNFILGNVQEFKKDELAFLTRCAQEYDEIVPLRLLHLSFYLLLNTDHIEYILASHGRDFVKSSLYKLGERLVGKALILNEGDFWLRQRRLMQPAFHRERIAGYGQIVVDYTERMLSAWQSGETMDVSHVMHRLIMEIVTKVFFNSETGDSEGMLEAFTVVLQEVAARFSNPVPIPENIPTPGNLRYLKAVQHLDQVVNRIIQQRRANPEDTGDLLSMLLQAQDEDGSRMTDLQLRDEMVGMFLGGYETTGATLAWMWYLLDQYPPVQAKLHAELEAVLGGRAPTVADLTNLPYTERIVMETLRLYPTVPLMGREVAKDFELGGHSFRAGTEFWIVPWVIHRSPRYYDAPDEFRPERWEGDLAKRLPKFAYFPFSQGPRVCIGNAFAMMEMRLVLATIAQRFQFKLVPGQMVQPKFSGSLRPKQPIRMILTEHRPASQLMLSKRAPSSVEL